MPVMRLVNTAIDGVASDPQAVMEDILRFASSDLLCYRADAPRGLVERQNEAVGPGLDWARAALGARFNLAEGIIHVEQPREAIADSGQSSCSRGEPLRLAAIHFMTSLTGSALLALAVDFGELDVRGCLGRRPCRRGLAASSTGDRTPRRSRAAPARKARYDGCGQPCSKRWPDRPTLPHRT